METTFAIVVEKLMAMCVLEGDGHQVDLNRGMLVEIRKVADRYSTIMIHDFYERNFAYENNLYLCKSSALFPVPLELWPFLIAVNDPFERLIIAKDKALIEYIASLKIGNFATVNGQLFNVSTVNQSLMFLPEREPKARSIDFECIVRYIGSVDEVGPGFIFGLELLVNF